jgi:heptosyltransferase II
LSGKGRGDQADRDEPRAEGTPFPGEILEPVEGGASATAEAPATAPSPLPDALPASAPARPSLVIQTSFLGDMVLTTPLIAELAKRGPVDVVATPASAPLLANNPSVRDVILYDKRGDAKGMTGLYRTAQALRRRQEGTEERDREAAAAYLAQGSVRSATLALLAGIPERVGFGTSAGRRLYTRRVPYREDRHHAERLWRLAMPPDVPDPDASAIRPRLFPADAEMVAVEKLLADAGVARGEPLLALAPGSIWGTKRWPYYAGLAARLAGRDPGLRLVVIGGRPDAALAREIADAVPAGRVIDATGRLSLLASAELIGRTLALVTNDSAPQHLASAMGTPTVAVFGPTVPGFGFGPLAPRRATVGHAALACRPCHRHGPRACPLGHWRCMREIEAPVLEESVDELLHPRG